MFASDRGAPSESPEAIIRRDRDRRWERLGLALFVTMVSGATSGVLILLGEYPQFRLGLVACAALALVLGLWGWFRLPSEQRTWSAIPKRRLAIHLVLTTIVIGIIAYGLRDYLTTTYVVGHDCTEDKECRSTHCFGARYDAPGVCTELCDADSDCPSGMICSEGRSVRPGEEITGGGEAVEFCVRGVRATQ